MYELLAFTPLINALVKAIAGGLLIGFLYGLLSKTLTGLLLRRLIRNALPLKRGNHILREVQIIRD